MEAILKKVMPIEYDKDNNVLFFAELTGEEFDTQDFLCLEPIKSNRSAGVPFLATHKIDFKKAKNNLLNRGKSNSKLGKLISKLEDKAQNDKVMLYRPLSMDTQYDNSWFKPVPADQTKDLRIINILSESSYQNTEVPNNQYGEEETAISLLHHYDVGHGLSIFDSENYILFDCGGTIDFCVFEDKLLRHWSPSTSKMLKIIISHDHDDHLNYLKNLLDKYSNKIERVILAGSMYKTKNLYALISDYEDKFSYMPVGVKWKFFGYDLFTDYHVHTADINKNSIIAIKDNWLLTGDLYFEKLSKVLPSEFHSSVEFMQAPHHGRTKSGHNKKESISLSFSNLCLLVFSDDKALNTCGMYSDWKSELKKANE